jgi:TrmH family RNA methyltransferase
MSSLDGDVVIMDRIQDVGNIGSILRTTAAIRFSKVLWAAMGAHYLPDLY